MKKTRDNKCWQECPGKGTLLVEIQTGTATTESRMEIPWGKKISDYTVSQIVLSLTFVIRMPARYYNYCFIYRM